MNRNIRLSDNIRETFDRWFREDHRTILCHTDWRVRDDATSITSTAFNGQGTYLTTSADEVGARPNTWTPSAADVGVLPDTTTIPTVVDGLHSGLYVDDLINYERNTAPRRYWEWSFDPVNMTYTARWEGKDDDFEPSEELDAFLESYKIIKEGENRE